jgi:cytochrome c biogenesis protein CcmG, thiol:disulfide interchange protein DsbE
MNRNDDPEIKKTGHLSLLCLAALILILWTGSGEAAPRIGDTLPSMTLSDLNGVPVKIPENIRGKVTVLHFWQIGCASCRLEMPAMNDLYNRCRRKGLEVLAVNVGQKKEFVNKSTAEMGLSYPILIDMEGKSASIYGVTDVPRTYMIDRSGVIRYRILGDAAPEVLKRMILSLL